MPTPEGGFFNPPALPPTNDQIANQTHGNLTAS